MIDFRYYTKDRMELRCLPTGQPEGGNVAAISKSFSSETPTEAV